MGGMPGNPWYKGRDDAARMQADMERLEREAVQDAARLAGLSAGKVTQTRARSASGGLAGGGQAQRSGGIQGGKIGGPLGKRGPSGGQLMRRGGLAGSRSLGTSGE